MRVVKHGRQMYCQQLTMMLSSCFLFIFFVKRAENIKIGRRNSRDENRVRVETEFTQCFP